MSPREPVPSPFDADLRNDAEADGVRAGRLTLSSQAFDSSLRIASIAILARLFMPESFGLVSMVTALTTAAEHFKDLDLSSSSPSFTSPNQR